MYKRLTRIALSTSVLAVLILSLISAFIPTSVFAVTRNMHWVQHDGGGTGDWSDTGHWDEHSGGGGGDAVPDTDDTVEFDANSFNGAGQVVTIGAAANCLDMDWTGATGTPQLAGSAALNIYGSVTFIAGMTENYSGTMTFRSTAVGKTVTMGIAWLTGSPVIQFDGLGGEWTLQDTVSNRYGTFYVTKGSVITGDHTISCGVFSINGVGVKSLDLGSSTVNTASSGGWGYSGSNLTFANNSATINIAGTGAFAGGSLTNYNIVNLTGTASTITGSNTFNTLALSAGTTQTISLAAGTRQTATTVTLSGDVTHQHTIKSGTAGTLASIWATNKTDNFVTYTDMIRNYNGVVVVDCSGVVGGTFAGAGGGLVVLVIGGALPLMGVYLGLLPMALTFIGVIFVVLLLGYYFFTRGIL